MQSQQDLRIEQQAIEWFALVRSDADLAHRVAEFEVWFHADVAHSQAYRELEALWAQVGHFDNGPEVIAARRDALEKVDCSST